MAKDLTSANCTFMLAITSLYIVPQVLENFVADNPFSTSDIEVAETVMSLEGKLSAGFVPASVTQTITLLPNSESAGILVDWIQASRTNQSTYRANGNIILPSLGVNYTLINGALKSGKIIPDSRRILQPITFNIEWENVIPVRI